MREEPDGRSNFSYSLWNDFIPICTCLCNWTPLGACLTKRVLMEREEFIKTYLNSLCTFKASGL